MLTRILVVVINLLLGSAISSCVGFAVGSLVGAFRALLQLFASKTAWLALITFLTVAYVFVCFGFGVLSLVSELGYKTHYALPVALLVGGLLGLGGWWMPIGIFAIGSGELIEDDSFKGYLSVFSLIIFLVCGFLGLLLIVRYLIIQLSVGWLFVSILLYPITFAVAPFVRGFKDGIWWPFLLNFGGLIVGGILKSFSEEK
jgi:hypothetical protein